MPAVGGMRRNTRVFGTRVLRSGRRLWEEVGKHGEYVEGEWIDMLDNSGDDRMSSKEIDFNVITKTDENNAVGRDVKNRWGAVYRRRKRKTLESEMSDEDRMYGKKYFRKRRRTTSTCDGIWDLDSQVVRQEQMCRVIVIVLENYGGSISFGLFSCFLNSILRYMRCNSLRLRLLSAFLHYQPILSVYSSHGIRLQQDCSSITGSGFCKIFGSRCCIPLFELDFAAVPFVFLHLHSSLHLGYATLPNSLLRYVNGVALRVDSLADNEEFPSCIASVQHKSENENEVSENGNSEKRTSDSSPTALNSVTRPLQLKNNVNSRIIKKRRRSIRLRRGRNILPFFLRKPNGALHSRYASIPFASGTSNYEHISPVRGNFTTNSKDLKSTLMGMTEDFSSSCTANLLIIEQDKCYREEGAIVEVEKSASNKWFFVIKRGGITSFNLMAEQVMRPCTFNRVTRAIIWTIDNGRKLEFPNRRDWSTFKKLYKECSDHNLHAPTESVIPVPQVLKVSSYDSNTFSFKRPQSYITWKDDELTRALTKGTANYDLDSDDEAWLNKFNNGSLQNNELDKHISADLFELIMNSFEKGKFCGEDDYFDVRVAIDHCKNLARKEVLEAVHSYWIGKRKHKRSALARVFQCYQPRKTPVIPKIIFRKKRSVQRQASKCGRDNQQTSLLAEPNAEDEQRIVAEIQKAKAAANRSEEMAVLKRRKTQMLMDAADLAIYKATMALRIAQAARHAGSPEIAGTFFL